MSLTLLDADKSIVWQLKFVIHLALRLFSSVITTTCFVTVISHVKSDLISFLMYKLQFSRLIWTVVKINKTATSIPNKIVQMSVLSFLMPLDCNFCSLCDIIWLLLLQHYTKQFMHNLFPTCGPKLAPLFVKEINKKMH